MHRQTALAQMASTIAARYQATSSTCAKAVDGQCAESRPAGTVLAGADLQADDLAVPIGGVHTRRLRSPPNSGRYEPAGLADPEHEQAGGRKPEPTGLG